MKWYLMRMCTSWLCPFKGFEQPIVLEHFVNDSIIGANTTKQLKINLLESDILNANIR